MNRKTWLLIGGVFAEGAVTRVLGTIALAPTHEGMVPFGTSGFRPSDARLLARTGTPQLVEFFHPD